MQSPPQTRPGSRKSSVQISPTANEFPRQAGQTLQVSKPENGPISPAKSTFSFDNDEPKAQAVSDMPDLIDQKNISRRVSRGAPGDAALMAMVQRDQEGTDFARRKSSFFTEVFAYREPNLSPRERIYKNSVIIAEVKTNVIVKDEFIFLKSLSEHLSQRYQRPTSSIFINLEHSACLLLGGTFDSAYMFTITALTSQIQPVTNKRNTALIQAFMTDTLGVSADRGVVRYINVGEEYLGTNGMTVLGEIDNLTKDDNVANSRRPSTVPSDSRRPSTVPSEGRRPSTITLGRGRSRKAPKPKELAIQETSRPPTAEQPPSLPSPAEKLPSRPPTAEKPPSPPLKSPPMPAMPTEKSAMDKKAESVQKKMGRRKSFLSIFGK